MDPYRRKSKSEFQMVLEFIGFKTLVVLGLGVSLYLYSGYYNYMQMKNFWRAFNPYYALHFHNGSRIIGNFFDAIGTAIRNLWNDLTTQVAIGRDRFIEFLGTYVNPFIQEHPILGFSLFFTLGIVLTAIALFLLFIVAKKAIYLLSPSTMERMVRKGHKEELWNFDPRRKPSEEQLKTLQRSLERLVQRAPAMGGSVPKNADLTIREMARRNHDSEYTYRNAIYVMGPIKGTKLDNGHLVPLALDQIKKISHAMGQAAYYEVLPLDLVLLRTKKGTKYLEIDPETAPISLGKTYPVGIIEIVMNTHRQYFIWDSRASKVNTGYGVHALHDM